MALYPNAQWKGPVPNMNVGGMTGYQFIVLHMMEGTLAGTDGWFHNATNQASAHFGVGKDGTVYQWVDTADKAWAEVAGNAISISIEHEGSTGDTLTAQQIAADGTLLAWIYTTHGILLQITDDPVLGQGIIGHSEGGAAWGGHTDPGPLVLAQRQALIDAAGPFVVSVFPKIGGNPAGGTTVHILGTGFTAATAVGFGATGATNMTLVSSSQITAISPLGNGVVDVTVTTPVGTSPTGAADQFSYASGLPVISSFNPTVGDPGGGAIVVITGSNLGGVNAINFGANPCVTSNIDSDTQITVFSPPGTGTVVISVVTDIGNATSGANTFTYTPPPTPPQISSVTPSTGTTQGGTTVVITGAGFTGAVNVSFGAVKTGDFNIDTNSQITVISPASGAGMVDISVTGPAGTSSATPADRFTFGLPAPTVTGISPASGPAAGGTTVVITGSGFMQATSVGFDNTGAPSLIFNSDTQITTICPSGTGTVDVTVTGPGGTSATVPADQFTYVAASGPQVTGINPNSGTSAGGDTVVITGSGFTGATAVNFDNSATPPPAVNSDAQITVTSPPGTSTVDVTVTTPSGTSPTSAADQFTYVGGPQVTGVNPNSGTSAGGDTVVITGSGFTGATGVDFDITAAPPPTVNSDTQITVISPPGTSTVDVTVTTPSGTSPISAADQFTYVAASGPQVTGVNPNFGTSAGGDTVVITGSGFTGATAVNFDNTAAPPPTVNSDTQITVTSPPGTSTVDVTVTTPSGTSPTSAADQFSYL